MTATQQTESAERIARPLIQLAKLNGISTSYIDQLGTYVEIRDEVLVSVLAALGVDASSDEAIAQSTALVDFVLDLHRVFTENDPADLQFLRKVE